MSSLRLALVALVALAAIGCSQQGSMSSGPMTPTAGTSAQVGLPADTPLSATMQFGIDTNGSPFPAPSGHDQSAHAKDNLVPRTVVIDQGGTVTFTMGPAPVHQVAIYDRGTNPSDIDTSIVTFAPSPCPPVPLINDPNNRLAVLSAQLCNGGSPAPTYTFNEPGRFLVICTFLPHFNVGMYGWVIVRDR